MPKNELDFDEDDDRPRKSRRPREEDEDDRPRTRSELPKSNGLATAALVLGILGFCTGLATAIPAIICGFLGLSAAKKRKGAGKGMAMTGLTLGFVSSLMWIGGVLFVLFVMKESVDVFTGMVEDLKRGGSITDRETSGKLKTLSVSTHKYQDTMGRMPNNLTADDLPGAPWNPRRWTPNQPPNMKNAPPFPTFLRSWRVELLPQVGEEQLYSQFKPDQAWNSAANKPLSDRRVEAYADSGSTSDTRFRGLTGSGTVFEPYQRIHFAAIPDGLSSTILVVEATDTAKWAEGNDLRYDTGWPEPPTPTPVPAIGRAGAATTLVVMCDGTVRRVNKNIDPMVFRRLAGRADGMVVEIPPLAD